jgi:hypothetical protein
VILHQHRILSKVHAIIEELEEEGDEEPKPLECRDQPSNRG